MSGPGRLRNAWRHRWVKVVSGVVITVVTTSAVGGGYLAWRYSQIDRPVIPQGVLASNEERGPENFLLVGSDSRAFVSGAADENAFGTEADVGAPHADTILLLRTFPDLGRVAMVSFPRDLYIPLAGTGKEDRINAAVQGGPERLLQTITENYGIPIHHYAQIDFRGFRGLVNAIDGVRIDFPAPVRDFDPVTMRNPTGLDIAVPGCTRLDGDQALAYVRSRHFEQLVDGEWQPDPAGDLNRIQRQQDFIRRTFHQTLTKGLLDPRRVNRLLDVAIGNVSLDRTLGVGDLLALGRQFRTLSPDSLQAYALPTTPGVTPAGAQVLFLDEVPAETVLDVFRGLSTEPAEPLASMVRLQVLNASGRAGEVRAAAFRLSAAGFNVPGIGTLPVRLDRTRIRFGTGQELAAELVAARLVSRPEIVGDPTIRGVDAVLDIGRDWQGVTENGAVPATAVATPTSIPGVPETSPVQPTTTTTAPEPGGC